MFEVEFIEGPGRSSSNESPNGAEKFRSVTLVNSLTWRDRYFWFITVNLGD